MRSVNASDYRGAISRSGSAKRGDASSTFWRSRNARTTTDAAGRSERVAHVDVNAPTAVLRIAVHGQSFDRRELVSEVETKQTKRRPVTQANTAVRTETCRQRPGVRPDIARVHEQHGAERADHGNTKLTARHGERLPSEREAGGRTRADLEASPAAQRVGAAEKISFRKGNVGSRPHRIDGAILQPTGDRHATGAAIITNVT